MKETALERELVDHHTFVAGPRLQTQANKPCGDSKRTVTLLIFMTFGWSLIEAPFDYVASNNDTWLLVLMVTKLIIIFTGAAAIADVRFARGIFAFIRDTSVLAISPGLPLEFERSVTLSLLSLIEYVRKTFSLSRSALSRCAKSHRSSGVARASTDQS